MPALLRLSLSQVQQHELEIMRDQHPQAYLRERAAALLKIATGQSVRQVALTGLLKPRDPDSVYEWLKRYQTEGLSGLTIRTGRGRKPKYFPPLQ